MGTGIGILISEEKISSTEDTPLIGFIADMPCLYYTRLITENVGFTGGIAVFPSLGFDSFGFKIKAGPHFRVGRWAFNPMLGYGFVHSSFENHSLESFLRNTPVSDEKIDYLISWGEIILVIDFAFTPKFSIYGEISCPLGYIEKHYGDDPNSEIVAGSYSGFATGFSCALGVGFSF